MFAIFLIKTVDGTLSRKKAGISPLRDLLTTAAFIFLLILIGARITEDSERQIAGIFAIVDGDTLVREKERFRLSGIDAPELDQICRRKTTEWHCGIAAREALKRLVAEKPIDCRGNRKDKYGRTLVACTGGDLDINAEMVLEGLAVAYGAYEKEEAEARDKRLGIWVGEFDRPQDWRKTKGEPLAVAETGFGAFLCRRIGLFCEPSTGGIK